VVGTTSTAHLLLLLLAGLRPPLGDSVREGEDSLTIAVVVPAHDEAPHITKTLDSIAAVEYDPARFRAVVVADNCSDHTAAVARDAGVHVLERVDPDHRGKGYALAWAFERVLQDQAIDAVCVIDADCEVSPNLLAAIDRRLRAGAEAAQAAYIVSDPAASTGAALRWAGFALFNVLRPRGRDRLGLSSGLLGTGMAFSRGLLERSPWSAFSYAEDREQHMRWVRDGARVAFVADAEVRTAAASDAGRAAQEARWESGRWSLATTLTVELLARGTAERDLVAVEAALEPALLPQSILATTNLAAVACAFVAGPRGLRRVACGALIGQASYVVGGLIAVGAPAPVWCAMARVPAFVLRRLGVVSRVARGRGPAQWQRTHR